MEPFRFVHAADLHLDSPLIGISGRLPDHVQKRVRDSTFRAFDRLVNVCVEQQADFLCIAGDVFDLAERSLRAQSYFQKGLKRLHEYGILVYVVHGNHDPADGGRMWLEWPSNVTFFSSECVESVPFFKDGQPVARIYGHSYPTAQFTERIVEQYHREDDSFAIGLLHTNVDGDQSHDHYAPCTKQDLIARDMDYWALGHIHKGGILRERDPCIAYAGNTQGRSIKESGCKGCYVVDVLDGQIERLTFHETHDVLWHVADIDATGMPSLQSIMDHMLGALDAVHKKYGGRPVIVQFRLTGVSEMHEALAYSDRLVALLEPHTEDWIDRPDWIWLDSVQVETQPFISRETLRESEGFMRDFLQLTEELKADSAELDRIKQDVLGAIFHRQEVKQLVPALSHDDLQHIIKDAEAEVLRLFYAKGKEGSR